MSVVTGRRLQRFWQKGIQPLKDLLGSHDIADLSEDGTVTGALSKLNTDIYPIAYCKSFSTQVTLVANGRTDFGITIAADEGYKYMGIANIDYSGSSSHLAIGKWSVGGNTCYISMQNLSNSQANVTVTINAMFIKSDCLRNN